MLFVVVLVMFVLVARSSFRDSAGALCGGAGALCGGAGALCGGAGRGCA